LPDRSSEPPFVIVRVLRVKVKARNIAAFDALFRTQVELMRTQPGLEYVKLARQIQPDGGEEVVLFEDWLTAAHLYAWVGPNLTEPRLVDGARRLIEEVVVSHYEALDKDAVPVTEAFDASADVDDDEESGSA